jgi:hypothetical protein
MVDTSKGGLTYLFFVPHHFWLLLLLPKSMDGYFSVMFVFGGGVVHAHRWEEGWGHHLVLSFFISLEYAIADYIV